MTAPSRQRLLLVDDDEDDFVILRDLLRELQRFELDWVSDYDAALSAIARDAHDLYLLDYNLGPHDGIELMREAIARGCKAPMIVLTGADDRNVDVRAMDAGAMDFLIKGRIDASNLERSIRYAINRKQIELELRAAKEAADAASRAKSEFLASMSHELRTPLNAILGFSQLLGMDMDLPKESRDHAREIERAGEHLLSLVTDLIDLARIEAGRLELSMEPVLVKVILAESLALVAPIASKQAIHVSEVICHSPIERLAVLADYVRLRQVVINLLSNAIKYNRPQGNVTLSCQIRDGRVRINVADAGPGIPLDKQGRIFSAFDRLGEELGVVEGTGIGLVITKRIVEAMGGEIGFHSVEDLGSSFWVEFPVVQPPELPMLEESRITSTSAVGEAHGNRLVILYVEDNAMNLRLMRHILAKRPDVELREATSAEAGIELARAQPPALILMDINLPGMDGYAALKVLKADPKTADIPVVALTANAMKGDREHGAAAGFSDYLTKPINIKELFALLDRLGEPKP